MTKKKIDWIKLLKEKRASCYIKPTRYKHESGFRKFEVGYLILGEGNKIEDKLVLGECSDHISSGFENPIRIKMDLTVDGYIRIWSRGGILAWEGGTVDYVVSSAELEFLK